MSNDDDRRGTPWAILFGVVLLVIGTVVGLGLYRATPSAAGSIAGSSAPASAASDAASADERAASATPVLAPAEPAASAASGGTAAPPTNTAEMTSGAADAASVRVEGGVVTFYFASASSDLPAGAPEALADVVKGVAAGQTAVIRGFRDTTGDPAKDEALAKQRAFAVRDALVALGIGPDKVKLERPEASGASGGDATEARRVEVTLD